MDLTLDGWLKLLTFAVLIVSTLTNVVIYVKTRSDKRFDALGNAIAALSTQQREDSKALRQELRNDFHALERRISIIEEWRKHVPTDEDLTRMQGGLADFARQLAAVDERSQSTLRVVNRIEQYLLEKRP